MSDIDRFWIESPDFEYGRKLVVLASDHDRVTDSLKHQNKVLAEQIEREREKVAALEKAARRERSRSLGVVKVVK